ncbi:hypothetical protein [Aurantimonas sp. Leaf443]|uniref:hypothetical protein n=1 Tax=Aurantimonas sp. Leaf443 TaxID=1736378 RepID=UPI000B00022A|nr:hypothetical protein [Aurantimonas sp. Leaf443]
MGRDICAQSESAPSAREARFARYAEARRAPVAERVLFALSLAVCLALVCGLAP